MRHCFTNYILRKNRIKRQAAKASLTAISGHSAHQKASKSFPIKKLLQKVNNPCVKNCPVAYVKNVKTKQDNKNKSKQQREVIKKSQSSQRKGDMELNAQNLDKSEPHCETSQNNNVFSDQATANKSNAAMQLQNNFSKAPRNTKQTIEVQSVKSKNEKDKLTINNADKYSYEAALIHNTDGSGCTNIAAVNYHKVATQSDHAYCGTKSAATLYAFSATLSSSSNTAKCHESDDNSLTSFVFAKRRRLRGQVNEGELWEGFPHDVRFPRRLSKPKLNLPVISTVSSHLKLNDADNEIMVKSSIEVKGPKLQHYSSVSTLSKSTSNNLEIEQHDRENVAEKTVSALRINDLTDSAHQNSKSTPGGKAVIEVELQPSSYSDGSQIVIKDANDRKSNKNEKSIANVLPCEDLSNEEQYLRQRDTRVTTLFQQYNNNNFNNNTECKESVFVSLSNCVEQNSDRPSDQNVALTTEQSINVKSKGDNTAFNLNCADSLIETDDSPGNRKQSNNFIDNNETAKEITENKIKSEVCNLDHTTCDNEICLNSLNSTLAELDSEGKNGDNQQADMSFNHCSIAQDNFRNNPIDAEIKDMNLANESHLSNFASTRCILDDTGSGNKLNAIALPLENNSLPSTKTEITTVSNAEYSDENKKLVLPLNVTNYPASNLKSDIKCEIKTLDESFPCITISPLVENYNADNETNKILEVRGLITSSPNGVEKVLNNLSAFANDTFALSPRLNHAAESPTKSIKLLSSSLHSATSADDDKLIGIYLSDKKTPINQEDIFRSSHRSTKKQADDRALVIDIQKKEKEAVFIRRPKRACTLSSLSATTRLESTLPHTVSKFVAVSIPDNTFSLVSTSTIVPSPSLTYEDHESTIDKPCVVSLWDKSICSKEEDTKQCQSILKSSMKDLCQSSSLLVNSSYCEKNSHVQRHRCDRSVNNLNPQVHVDYFKAAPQELEQQSTKDCDMFKKLKDMYRSCSPETTPKVQSSNTVSSQSRALSSSCFAPSIIKGQKTVSTASKSSTIPLSMVTRKMSLQHERKERNNLREDK